MIPELGHVALILALQLALVQSVLCLAGAARNQAGWMRAGKSAANAQLLFVLASFAALAWAYYANDFSVLNVAEHSSRQLPTPYRLTATWGSHEGSMMLWVLILSGWTVALNLGTRQLPLELKARVLGVIGGVSAVLLAFVLFTSNPFLRLDPPPPEGMDLNPLLQDPGMIIHPPLLYMGYVGFVVAFAFAIATMLGNTTSNDWARWARPWTQAAWGFLTLGITVGSWWAYYELGWGGWWFWDPTENASLMPWLAGTALMHALTVTEKRGKLHLWSIFLAITVFSLCLVGTFLVRSGVLSSVHAFALDPARGLFILLFLVLVIGGALLLFALRASSLLRNAQQALVTHEVLVLSGNVLLLVAAATVLLGTLYPLILDALDLGKVSVGPPYFNAVFVPLMVPVLLLVGLAMHARGHDTRLRAIAAQLKWHGLAALMLGAVVPLLYRDLRWPAMLAITLASWITLATVQGLVHQYQARGRQALSVLGMSVAHIGLAISVVGVGFVSSYESEQDLAMRPGDTASLAGYTLTFRGVTEVPGPNFSAVVADLIVSRDGNNVDRLNPEKRVYHASRKQMTESAIRYSITGDLYAALGEPLKAGAWSVRLYHKPLVIWIWLGALVMASGAAIAILARRLRSMT
ncbi:heme lyase CcmF/NrfE family subunit [Rhodoferax sp.]|uniref:heme lyase CcmF/NrfE family subunit n=1 Tax=Rhodoferax sp. TaxID=50421 RepID=UPI002733CF6F|nr:heme lyase CcmF/NrfE family subunit [Rhodoferax sp.]MDP3191927.1 heme lyase CcmF/NrfE family subunit [Rhodoferax sp.]MDP3336132.1 heme lyase CcmF/NrfE family subunit [Rhodoferax sp.]